MQRPCIIEVKSRRNLNALEWAGQEEASPDDEAWEELLWEAGFDPDDAYYTDHWKEKPAEDNGTVLTAHGLFSQEEDGSFRISYEDTEITGLEGCLTTFCLSPSGMLIMLRRGSVKTCMVFEDQHRHLCDYGATGGLPSVFLHTHSLESKLSEEGGEISVSYSVEIRGTLTEQNALFISVTPM